MGGFGWQKELRKCFELHKRTTRKPHANQERLGISGFPRLYSAPARMAGEATLKWVKVPVPRGPGRSF